MKNDGGTASDMTLRAYPAGEVMREFAIKIWEPHILAEHAVAVADAVIAKLNK